MIVLMMALAVSDKSAGVHATSSTLDRLNQKKQEKEQTENQKEDAQQNVDQMNQQKNSLMGELNQLNSQLTDISNNLQELEKDVAEKEKEITETQADLAEAQETEEEQYETMKKRIKFMYERGDAAMLETIFAAKSFGELLNKSDYIEQLNAYDRQKLEEYKQTKEQITQVEAELEQEKADLDALMAQTREEQSKISGLVSNTQSHVANYSNQINQTQAQIDAYEAQIAKQNQDIVALQKQYEEELALSRLAAQSAWRDISQVTFEEDDRYLLANLIYCEAGGEPYAGKLGVGSVVINRLLSSRYPNTVVGVIYQNRQFSPVASGRLAYALANDKATAACYQAADEAMKGVTNVGMCVYFRTPIEGLTGISIGGHIFY